MKSKDKGIIFIIIGVLLCLIIGIHIFLITKENKDTTNDGIPDGYIAVFHGGVGERTYETYIYKIDNGHANMGFKYVNTTSTTKSWGSYEWNSVVTGSGTVDWTDAVFTVAKENGAYSYVTIPNSDDFYTIEQFQSMFIMD